MEHLQLRITGIKEETSLSKSYFAEEINNHKIVYKAGQFLTLIFHLNRKEIRRSYSIGSSPAIDDNIFFTVKRIENGEISRYIFDTLQVGDIITSLPPTGRFILNILPHEQVLFLAAGSGITPVFSLIKELLYKSSTSKVVLIYQNRNEHESIFRKEILLLKNKFEDRFILFEIFSQSLNQKLPHLRLNNILLEKILLQSFADINTRFYLCGPEAFMRMAQFTLKAMGFRNELIRKENFFATPLPPPFITDKNPHNVIIYFRHQVHHIKVAYPQTILDAALKHHIPLPYSCKGGRCSTCTAICTAGKVKMSSNDVLTPQDLENGLILTCVAYPETDVEIRFE